MIKVGWKIRLHVAKRALFGSGEEMLSSAHALLKCYIEEKYGLEIEKIKREVLESMQEAVEENEAPKKRGRKPGRKAKTIKK